MAVKYDEDFLDLTADSDFGENSSKLALTEEELLGEEAMDMSNAPENNGMGTNNSRKRGGGLDTKQPTDSKIFKAEVHPKLEDLPPYDDDDNKSYAQKIVAADGVDARPKLRGYQEEISVKILRGENDIIVLPTGTGKTAVAANLILHHLEADKEKGKRSKVLFLVPTNELAKQQVEVIKEYLGVDWSSKCTRLTGEDILSMDYLEDILNSDDYSVIVATPKTVDNYFVAFTDRSMSTFTLVVFDECHNIQGNAPYTLLLNRYVDEKLRMKDPESKLLPQLVGLTATVGTGSAKDKSSLMKHITMLCALFDLKASPTEVLDKDNAAELNDIDLPCSDIKVVEAKRNDKYSQYIKETIVKSIVADVKRKMASEPMLAEIEKRFKPPSDAVEQGFNSVIDQIIKFLEKCDSTSDVVRECIIELKHLQVYHKALHWANLATIKASLEELSAEMALRSEIHASDCWKRFNNVWKVKLSQFCDKEMEEYPNMKLTTLKSELDKVINKERIDDDYQARVMIFVEERKLAIMLSKWLKSLGPQYKAERFVSQLSEEDGMSKSECLSVMKEFRDGHLNILVTTSVLGEGIDIPECNGTIRYMYMKDAVAEVQIPGRVRSKDGKVVGIFNDALNKRYKDNKMKERWMNQALAELRGMDLKEFQERIAKSQNELHKDYCQKIKAKSASTLPNGAEKPTDAIISCRQCKREVGSLSNLYCYLECHFIILDEDLADKVNVVKQRFNSKMIDGMKDSGILKCKGTSNNYNNCNAFLGTVKDITIQKEKRALGSWSCTKISFRAATSAGSDEGETCSEKKWSKVQTKFHIADIDHPGLRDRPADEFLAPISE